MPEARPRAHDNAPPLSAARRWARRARPTSASARRGEGESYRAWRRVRGECEAGRVRVGVGDRQGARLGITFLGAGAVALLVLEVVQPTAGAFEPRPEIRAALAGTVAF